MNELLSLRFLQHLFLLDHYTGSSVVNWPYRTGFGVNDAYNSTPSRPTYRLVTHRQNKVNHHSKSANPAYQPASMMGTRRRIEDLAGEEYKFTNSRTMIATDTLGMGSPSFAGGRNL